MCDEFRSAHGDGVEILVANAGLNRVGAVEDNGRLREGCPNERGPSCKSERGACGPRCAELLLVVCVEPLGAFCGGAATNFLDEGEKKPGGRSERSEREVVGADAVRFVRAPGLAAESGLREG